MARKDLFHFEFRTALENDGWEITDDPLIVKLTESRSGEIDFGAEKVIAAEKGKVKIAVEVKTFLAPSFVNELHRSVGQFLNYRLAMRRAGEKRQLFLAVPEATWQKEFQDDFLKDVIDEFRIDVVTYDPYLKTIIQWRSK